MTPTEHGQAIVNAGASAVRETAGQLRQQGFLVRDEDVTHLSPFIHERHINLLGRYSFAVPEAVTRGELRPLRNPNELNA